MRDIKFRCWKIDWKDSDPASPQGKMHEDVNLGDYRLEVWWNFPSNHILMQSTGLFDKNGKQIYEGDILSRKSPYSSYSHVDVFWNEKDAMWDCRIGKVSQGGLWKNVRDEEIIGNIYQNPEILSANPHLTYA